MFSLRFTHAKFERDHVRADYDLEIGVVGTLSVNVAAQVIYQEVMFPIVELRVALGRWMSTHQNDIDFEFVSMESDEVGLVWLRCQPSGNWRIGSVHQDQPAFEEFTWPQVADAVDRYIAKVDEWVELVLGLNVLDIIQL